MGELWEKHEPQHHPVEQVDLHREARGQRRGSRTTDQPEPSPQVPGRDPREPSLTVPPVVPRRFRVILRTHTCLGWGRLSQARHALLLLQKKNSDPAAASGREGRRPHAGQQNHFSCHPQVPGL